MTSARARLNTNRVTYPLQLTVTRETLIKDNGKVLRLSEAQLQQLGCGRVGKSKIRHVQMPRCSNKIVVMEFTLTNTPDLRTFKNERDYFAHVRREWCKRNPEWPWLGTDDIKLYSLKGRKIPFQDGIAITQLSLGTFIDRSTYVSHYESSSDMLDKIVLKLEHDRNILTLMLHQHIRQDIQEENLAEESAALLMSAIALDLLDSHCNTPYKLELQYNDMHKLILVDDNDNALDVYFSLKYPPRLEQADSRGLDAKTNWKRKTNFPGCNSDVFGNSSVFRLRFTRDARQIKRAFSRFRERAGFKIYYTPMHTIAPPTGKIGKHLLPDFNLKYAVQCLLSRGFVVTDQLESLLSVLRSGISQDATVTTKAIFQLAIEIENTQFLQIDKALEYLIMQNLSDNADDDQDTPPPTCRYVRRVMATPSRLIFLQPELMFENRVLRQYREEYCARIVFRDENYQQLSNHASTSEDIERMIMSTLLNGFSIVDRQYDFLACSNSQLRDHGCWFYARDPCGNTSDTIRGKLGDFSKIRCVATYVSRMGQCFSTSEETVPVKVEEGMVIYIDDNMGGCDPDDKEYCFSDGIGKLSRQLAEEVKSSFKLLPE